jgi:hypothetical protein
MPKSAQNSNTLVTPPPAQDQELHESTGTRLPSHAKDSQGLELQESTGRRLSSPAKDSQGPEL